MHEATDAAGGGMAPLSRVSPAHLQPHAHAH
jgi:hypothetical protein